MAGKILLINQGPAMIVERLAVLLKEAGIETAVVEPSAKQIKLEKDDVSIFVLFTGDFVYDAQDFLEYLKDVCYEADKPLCVVGYDKELEKVTDIIESAKVADNVPREVITHKFTRPFDVKVLAAKLTAMLSAEEDPDSQKQILVVDDDFSFLQTVRGWLGGKYSVAVARSGMQAIRYLAEHKADLILLDYDMPVTPGPQVLEALRSEPMSANIPVFFLTGKSDRDSVMSVMHLKPDGYLLKSMNKEDILASLDRFFKTKKWQNL